MPTVPKNALTWTLLHLLPVLPDPSPYPLVESDYTIHACPPSNSLK
jgi:hypothetical protein